MLPKASYPILISRLLERTAYYGYRTVLVLHLIKGLQLENPYEYFGLLGMFAALVYFLSPLGGLIGDLGLGTRITAITGAGIMTVGMLMLCLPGTAYLYPSVLVTALGSAFYGPNAIALYAKNYQTRADDLDSGFTLFYVFVNAGGVLSTVVLDLFMVENATGWVIVITAVIAASAIIPLLFVNDITAPEIIPVKTNDSANTSTIFIILAIALPALYWMFYEYAAMDQFALKSASLGEFMTDNETMRYIMHIMLNLLFVVLFGIALLFVWKKIKPAPLMKLGIGFALGGIAFLLIYFLPTSFGFSETVLFVFALMLLALSELFIAPTSLSMIASFTKPKYYALLFGTSIASVWFLKKIFDSIVFPPDTVDQPVSMELPGLIALLFIGITLVVVSVITKKTTTP